MVYLQPWRLARDDLATMIWFDWLAVLILAALAVRGYARGLILQISAVVAVGMGLFGGLYLHSAAAALLPEIAHPVLKLVAGFTVVFVAVALSVNFLARALKTAVDALLLGIVDRLLGAVLGVILEHLIVRHLYGRPLDTLLATFGVSLGLQQLARQLSDLIQA